jgi:DNA ligase D-like protein (predicted 3'-phosphoesterase)
MPLAPVIRAGSGARGPCTGSFSKQAAFVLGIPDMSNYGKPHEGLPAGELVKYVLQQHDTARRPGRPHYDLRLGRPETGLYSWAVPKAQMPEPGQKRLAPQTQVHSYGYGDFTGRIGKGYGAGTVTMADKGQALITKVTPNSVSFTVAHAKIPRRFTLIKIPQEKLQTNKPQWLLLGVPAGKNKVPGIGNKPSYQLVKADTLEDAMAEATQVQAKLDGAHGVYDINERGKLEAYSVNPRVSGDPVLHTERLGLHHVSLPKLRNTTLRGEIFGTGPTGKAISFNELSGILNSNLAKSLETQKAKQIALRNAPFGVIQYRGKPFTGGPDEQRALLEAIIKQFPQDRFQLPESATTPEAKRQLLERIRSGADPLTQEGVVMHVGGRRLKYKLRPEKTLYLRGTFPGEGKRKGLAGGLLAGSSKTDPGNIRLGTGFTDEQLADIVNNLPSYLNRPVRVEHQGEFGSGLLRAPAFKGFETDKSAEATRAVPAQYPRTPTAALLKEAIIKRRGKGWALMTRDGRRVLGKHKTRTSAMRQERAILMRKAGQWTLPPPMGRPMSQPRPVMEDPAQRRRNAVWASQLNQRPATPPSIRQSIEVHEQRPKPDEYISVTTPGGQTIRMNVSMWSRDLGINPGDAPGKPYILPEATRLKLQELLAKGQQLSKAVESMPAAVQPIVQAVGG